jgi:hypothetical protein
MSSKPSTLFGRWETEAGELDREKRKRDLRRFVLAALIILLLAALAGSGGSNTSEMPSDGDVEPVPTTPTPEQNTTTPNDSGPDVNNETSTETPEVVTEEPNETDSEYPEVVVNENWQSSAATGSVENVDQEEYYESIQPAINEANSGDTIVLHGGTYTEYVNVNESVALVGRNGATIVKPDGPVWAMHVDGGPGAVVRDITVQGAVAVGSGGVEVQNLEIHEGALSVVGSPDVIVEGTTISHSRANDGDGYPMYGFRIQDAENLVIRGSSTTGGYVGLSAHNVTDVTVEDSSFNNAENAGVRLEQTDAVLRGVTVSDSEKGILASKSTVSVTETTISGNDYGIYLMFNNHVTLDDIDFTNNGENIHDETGDSTVNR